MLFHFWVFQLGHIICLGIQLKPFDECWKKEVKRYYVETNSSNQNRVDIVSGGSVPFETEFKSADKASKIKPIPLSVMSKKYSSGKLY